MSRDSNDAGDEDFSVVGTRGGAISRRGFIGGAFAISATGAILSQLQQTRALAAPPTFNPDGTVAFHAWDPAYLIYSDWYADGQSIFVTDAGYPGGGYYRVESSAAPVDGAYTVRYRFQVPESGLYDMRWSSTPPNVTWASPFYLAVNGNQYGYIGTGAGRYDQINPTVQCYDQGLEQFYNAATTLEANTATAPDPIALHTGLNTISFRVKDPRSLDGKYVMYLNSIALTPADPQPGSISQSKPLGVYSASDSVNFTVNMTAAIVTATTMTVMISDYWHTVVWTGTFAVPAGTHGILVAPPAPGLGYYQVDVTLAGGSQPIRSQFAVVSSSVPASSPFGSDVALTELVPTSRVSDYARAISLAGITRVRERYGWNVVNPSSGTYDYSSVDPALTAFSSHSTKVLAVYGQAPNWAVTGGNKLPADLRSIYNFAKAAGTHSAGTVATWEQVLPIPIYSR